MVISKKIIPAAKTALALPEIIRIIAFDRLFLDTPVVDR